MPKGVYKRTKEMNTGKYERTKEMKRKMSIAQTGKKHDIGYHTIHKRAHKADPKPIDNKCQLCDKVADKEGKTKLVHSNKDHTYRMPINPDEWWWIHQSCHLRYDWTPERRKEQADKIRGENSLMRKPKIKEKRWTPERKKEQSEMMKKNPPMKNPEIVKKWKKSWTLEKRKEQSERAKKQWTPEKRKEQSEKVKKAWPPERRKKQSERMKKKNKENNPMTRPEVIEKANKTKRKNRANKSRKLIETEAINSAQLIYWLK